MERHIDESLLRTRWRRRDRKHWLLGELDRPGDQPALPFEKAGVVGVETVDADGRRKRHRRILPHRRSLNCGAVADPIRVVNWD